MWQDYDGLTEPIPGLPRLIPLWRTRGSFTAPYKHTATGSPGGWGGGGHEAFESLASRCEREPEPLAGTPAKRQARIDRSIARTGESQSRASQMILACHAW